jgi:hypothetical protein
MAEEPGLSWEDRAKRLKKKSGEALRSEYRRAKDDERLDQIESDKTTIEFFHKEGEAPDWRDLAAKAESNASHKKRIEPLIKATNMTINTKKPIGLVFSGDWHLGDASIDYSKWLKDIETVIEHDRLFLADLGDDRQNVRAFKDLSAVLGQALSPQEQGYMIRGLVDELTQTNTLLCKVDGNHDVEFDERIFGEAIQYYLLQNMKAPRFRNKGLIFLEVGDETYAVYVFHKTRFRSIYRAAHGAWREWQFGYPADIVAGGHDHQPAFEMLPNYTMARDVGKSFGGMTFLIKCGTYQDSKYGWKYFHNGGRPEAIVVVLWPDEHRMQAFLSIQDAVKFLDTF